MDHRRSLRPSLGVRVPEPELGIAREPHKVGTVRRGEPRQGTAKNRWDQSEQGSISSHQPTSGWPTGSWGPWDTPFSELEGVGVDTGDPLLYKVFFRIFHNEDTHISHC